MNAVGRDDPKPQPPERSCPICGKPASTDRLPFCSKRCADVDLNRWLSGVYSIPGQDARGREADGEDE